MKSRRVNNRANTHRQITLTIPGDGSTTYVDIAACLSLMNVRKYEQGRVYSVKAELIPYVFTQSPLAPIADSAYEPRMSISALGNTYATHLAWQTAKNAYDASRKEELATGIKAGKWEDFAVGWNSAHLLRNTDNASPPGGDWARGTIPMAADEASGQMALISASVPTNTDLVFSKVQALGLGGGTRGLCFFGTTDATNFGMLDELNKARNVVDMKQQNPTDAGAAYAAVDQNVDGTTADLIEDDGDSAPYLVTGYKVPLHYEDLLSLPQAGFARSRTAYFDAPCGLLAVRGDEIDFSGEDGEGSTAYFMLQLTVQEGKYQGVSASPMGI